MRRVATCWSAVVAFIRCIRLDMGRSSRDEAAADGTGSHRRTAPPAVPNPLYEPADQLQRRWTRPPQPEELELLSAPKTSKDSKTRSGIGICCSGGGIRSAAFNLGALQSLAKDEILHRADYLSAVSGGSYIAGAFAMMARHTRPHLLEEQSIFAPGSPEEAYVRNRCSYLAAGMYGKARLVASVVVGFAANLLFLTAMLFSLRFLGWFLGEWQESLQGDADAHLQHLGIPSLLVIGLTGLGLALAMIARVFYPRWRRRRLLNRTATVLVIAALALATVTIVLPWLVVLARDLQLLRRSATASSERTDLGILTTAGLTTVLGASVTQIAGQLRGAFELGKRAAAQTGKLAKLNARLRRTLLYIAGGLVGPLGVLAGTVLVLSDAARGGFPPSGWEMSLWILGILSTLILFRFADVTSWSMHPFYKRRLASAFAVRRTTDAEGYPVARELPYNEVLSVSSFASNCMQVPFPELIVCAAANVSDPGLTPPGSAIASFVFSPSLIGGKLVGGMRTEDYEKAVGKRRRADVTLPAAMAMSGAALSPAMGKMTIAPLRFLMALANVRLGVWMPNPGKLPIAARAMEERTMVAKAAASAVPANPRPLRLLYEVIGRHTIRSRYLYVTDGGHYENLGLVELLRRRCTTILCFDAAGDSPETFSTIGQAIALARAEENVEIHLDPTSLRPTDEKARLSPLAVTTGRVTYDDGIEGKIVFARAAVTATAPWDVRAYAERDEEFPTHPTASQLYTGQRFEAYRVLGAFAGNQVVEELKKM